MSSDDVQSGFVRQRRFLIALSISLACASYLGFTLDKINVLGNDARIEHPERVFTLAYIAWVWAIIRYVQWFNDCDALAHTRNAYQLAFALMLRRRFRKHPPEIDALAKIELENKAENYWNQSPHRAPIPALAFVVAPTGITTIDGSRIEMQFDITAQYADGREFGKAFGPERMQVPVPSKYLSRLRRAFVFLKVLVARRYLLEYFAPFAIALLPMIPVWPEIVEYVRDLFN